MSLELIRTAWQRVRGSDPPEDLPDDPALVVLRLVPDEPTVIVDEYRLGNDEDLPVEPWRELVIGGDQELAQIAWVLDAAEMAILGRCSDDGWLVFDCVGDAEGHHATLELSVDGKRGKLLFSTTEELLQWLAAPEDAPVGRNVELSESSALTALTLLWKLHPAELFDHHRQMTWPKDAPPDVDVDPSTPDWRRRAVAWTLASFRRDRSVALPPGIDLDALSAAHELLNDQLENLEVSLRNDEVPALIADLSLDDDDAIATAALEWMIQFDRRREQGPDEDEENVAEQTKSIIRILTGALEELLRLEHIEVEENRRPRLIEDLLEVVLKTNTPNRLVPNLIEALLDSRHVEEVYATDNELERTLSKALGI